ncbi:MAG: DEAD/DEAH box helicase [Pseudomonadota bacterium]
MIELEAVAPGLRDAMTARGYHELTPVQRAVLEPGVSGRDMLVSAQTGSGKTVAFGLALAESLLAGEEKLGRPAAPLALIVAPTRELALQIRREFEWLYQSMGAVIGSCVGGMDMRTERRRLEQGSHIVIGTPGRLRDHIQRSSLVTDEIRAVVLDEADEMLDLGFREDLEFILSETPAERRTLLFSATVPRGISNLASKYQNDAARVSTTEEKKQHSDIDYRALTVAASDRENAIVNVLRFYEARNAIIFCATRATVNHITARFNNRGFSVVALSGELTQNERSHALQAMRDGRARVCIATDVAARGIDLPNLELVVHADLPTNGETLLHRSGRTGRAGRKGVSILIVPGNKRRSAERLLASAKIRATWDSPPSAEEVAARDDDRLLAHTALQQPIQENESELVRQLVSKYSAEQIAQAFVGVVREGQSAPEELQDVSSPEPRSRQAPPRLANSVWFSLSVGRKQKAEPGWLLPALCKGGGLTKPKIGAIRVQQDRTLVEIDADSVDQFLASIGPNATLQKSIRIVRLEEAPEFEREKSHRGKKLRNARGEDQKSGRSRSSNGGKEGLKKSGKSKFQKKQGKPTKADVKQRKRKTKQNPTESART